MGGKCEHCGGPAMSSGMPYHKPEKCDCLERRWEKRRLQLLKTDLEEALYLHDPRDINILGVTIQNKLLVEFDFTENRERDTAFLGKKRGPQ